MASGYPQIDAITATLTIIAARTGGVTVCKQVSGEAGDTRAEFTFIIMLSDTDLSGTYGDMVFSKGVATFTLKHGESKTAIGLPAGVRYSVSEQNANRDGYATTTGESGTIAANTTATAVFVNARVAADVPHTGDDGHMAWWLALMGLSVWGLVACGCGLKRKQPK